MIIHSLCRLYDRLSDMDESPVAQFGFAPQNFDFAIEIDSEGNFIRDIPLVDERTDNKGKIKKFPRKLRVPFAGARSSGVSSNFLWDNTGYVLGVDTKGKPERTELTHTAFKELLHDVGDSVEDAGMQAVIRFVDSWKPEFIENFEHSEDIVDKNVCFRLEGERRFVHDSPVIRKAWVRYSQESTDSEGRCIITGEKCGIERTHPKIKGVRGAQAVGASIISFNQDVFESYGNSGTQGMNSPVGVDAAFAYTTALNYLLSNDGHKIVIGDTTTVFWAERETPFENAFTQFLSPQQSAGNDAEKEEQIRLYLEAMRDGKNPNRDIEDNSTKFYILGLSPNAARISIRFFHVDTVGGMKDRMKKFLSEMRIEKPFEKEREFPGIYFLLSEIAVQGKAENIPPLLTGNFMRSIITGQEYPQTLLSMTLLRIRSDSDHRINYRRTSIIKAVLTRNHNIKEIKMSLDLERKDKPYLLGRLFAALEKAQKDALGNINATIKDRYFGSASTTPGNVFPLLLELSQHHMSKAEYGYTSDKLIGQIVEDIDSFPKYLNLEDQGLFTIGYYHQKNDIYRSKKDKDNKEEGNE